MTRQTTSAPASAPVPCEVLVIGGGPAGAAVATLLARQGRRVVLLEKAHHPRFHIGESLLPASLPLLRDLGVHEQVAAIGLAKWGVEFNSPDHARRSAIEFADAWDKSMPMAWQVRRSDFDEILFRHAASQGAFTLEGCHVRQVEFDAEGATVQGQVDDGSVRCWRAKYVVDASGRDTLLAQQHDWKRKSRSHVSAALFGHFKGARRLEGKREGDISIFWFAHGWFWFIPLADGCTSVGAVCPPHYLKTRAKPLQAFFEDTIALAPELADRLQGATLVDDQVWATGNYSYASRQCQGERFILLGDAYAFIDPVFSSGVHLALAGAFAGADLLATLIDRPAEAAAARRRFDALMQRGPREFAWFIQRMTSPAMRDLFMQPQNPLRMQEAVMSLLAGDIYGRTPIWGALRLFKGVYWIGSLLSLPRSWRAWRRRRRMLREPGPIEGENVIVPAA